MQIRNLPSNPEIVKRLTEIYGGPAKNIEDATCWDDLIIPEEKHLTYLLKEEMDGREQCPFFKVRENHFNYCMAKAKRLAIRGLNSLGDKTPSHKSAEYHAKLGHLYLQYWCLRDKSEHNTCIDFPSNKLK